MIQAIDVTDIHVLDEESSDCIEKYPKHSTPIKEKKKKETSEKSMRKSLAFTKETSKKIPSPSSKHIGSNSNSPNTKDVLSQISHGSNSLELSTIQKQRQEIQLLVAELKERDNELNEMVTAHQQQLLSWEHDRKRLLTLEQKCQKYKGELLDRSQQLEKVTFRMKDLETQCTSQLENSKEKLTQLLEEKEFKSNLVQSLEDKNRSLNDSLKEVSCTVGQLAAREQEIITLLKIREKEIAELKEENEKLSIHYKQMEKRNNECHEREKDAFSQSTKWQQKYNQSLLDVEQLQIDVQERDDVLTQQIRQINEAQEHMIALQEALLVSNEREKCKDDLLTSLKSKQDRTVSELRSVRELYERQQRELTMLQITMDTSHNEDTSNNHPSTQSHNSSNVDVNIPELDSCNIKHGMSYKQTSFEDKLSTFLYMDKNKEKDKSNTPLNQSIDEEQTNKNIITASPGSKLQKLLTESKNMLDNLERSTLSKTPTLHSQGSEEGFQPIQADNS